MARWFGMTGMIVGVSVLAIMGLLLAGYTGSACLAAIVLPLALVVGAKHYRPLGPYTATCPHCGERIRPDVAVCRTCSRDVHVRPQV